MLSLEALQKWFEQVEPQLEVEPLVSSLLENFLAVGRCDWGYLLARDEDTGRFRLIRSAGAIPRESPREVEARALALLAGAGGPTVTSELPADSPLRFAVEKLAAMFLFEKNGECVSALQLCIPLEAQEELHFLLCMGRSEELDARTVSFDGEDLALITALWAQGQRFVENAVTHETICKSYSDLVNRIGDAIDSKDAYGRGHSRTVAYYAELIARQMRLSEEEVELVGFAALLHDLGKIPIPNDLLEKDPPLGAANAAILRSYSETGARFLEGVPGLASVIPLIRHQTEWFDGSGYPDGLRGENIPRGARILSVAHRFTAMLSPRAYRRPLRVTTEALNLLRQDEGRQLDPAAVEALIAALGRSEGRRLPAGHEAHERARGYSAPTLGAVFPGSRDEAGGTR